MNNGGCGKVFDVAGAFVRNGGDVMQRCYNTDFGPLCGTCPTDNYIAKGPDGCQDVDECSGKGTGSDCKSGTLCINLVGGYQCNSCPPGFQGAGKTGCVDINECLPDPLSGRSTAKCDQNAVCINSDGSYECQCKAGFRGGGAVKASAGNIAEGASASPRPNGSARSCPMRARRDAIPSCRASGAVACLDINECIEGLDIDPGDADLNAEYPCNGQQTICVNTPGELPTLADERALPS